MVRAAFDAALAHPAVRALEHASLFVGGVLLWTQIVDPARRCRLTPGRSHVETLERRLARERRPSGP